MDFWHKIYEVIYIMVLTVQSSTLFSIDAVPAVFPEYQYALFIGNDKFEELWQEKEIQKSKLFLIFMSDL